jgi:energy-coupling factor transporter ATP-binding protein EcfA2
MDTSTLFQNGARWLRADFHLHTKADREFTYAGAENDFVNTYVNKLVEQNIRVGVITNHNKFDKGEFVALKKNAKEKGIGLFPGVEFSLKEGIHILIVFDDAWYKGDTDNINEFLRAAFYGISNYDTPPYPNSTCDLISTVEMLDKIGHNYFIILAHVDTTNGLNEVLQGRTREAFIQHDSFGKVLAIQKSGDLERYTSLCQFAGRKVACVEGSDNAQKGIDGIGEGRITYVKIGDFNFEALQYALIDHKNRVMPKESPLIQNSWIRSISFQGGLLDGKSVCFSPELNNLIGIRGSGKSSILEILRYALNIPLGSQAVDSNYKNDLIAHVLKSGGKVTVELVNRHGVIYRVERIYGQNEDIYQGDELQQGITLDAILQRPVYFGQKDLSNKNADFENDLVNKLIGGRLNDVKKKIELQKQDIQRIVFSLKEYNNLSQLRKETEAVKNNSEHKLKLFEEKGVSEKLQKQTNFESDINKINNYISGIRSYVSDLMSLIQNYEYLIKSISLSPVNQDASKAMTQQQEKLKEEIERLKSVLNNSQKIKAEFDLILTQLKEKRDALKEEFAQIKREINIPELNPDDFIKINRELETSKLKLLEIDKSETKRKELLKMLTQACADLDSLWHEEFSTLQKEVDKINHSGTKLSIDISYKDRKDKFSVKLQDLCKGSGIRGTACESIVASYADFIDMRKNNFAQLSDILNENQLVDFKKRFFNNLFDLVTFKVENRLTIKFEDKSLKDHSLGQRASALILFLLTQKENDILIIDQPEDDLDNQTIYQDVIHEIKKLKGEMQFIFATHNANIPVLGDSEMVVACEYINGKEIKIEKGSIDRQPVQQKIISIMEGGKEAFNIRRKIYKIWEAVNL